jgi:hypothetical protein
MGYTLLQKTSVGPTFDQLKRAFASVPGFTAYDAATFCKEPFGIIVRNFTRPQTEALQSGLKAQGVETEIIEDAQLPAVPATKLIRKLECPADALMIYDPYGRKFPVAWDQLTLIAAGNVQKATFERQRSENEEIRIKMHGMMPTAERKVTVEYTTRENTAKLLCAEIVLGGGAAQYSIEADRFDYECLGKRVSYDKEVNFTLLLRELAKNAPRATLNRGAAAMLAEPPVFTLYPHKNSLQDEIQWRLWQLKNQV